MAEQIMKNIYRLPVTLEGSPLKELNTYLICGGKRNLLIDTGYRTESCRKALFDQLALFGLGPGDVDVLLTHLHADHSGLATEATGSTGTIYISKQDSSIFGSEYAWQQYRARSDERMRREGFPQELIAAMSYVSPSRSAAAPRNVPHVCLQDGEVLQAGEYTLQCVLTPGHTPGHLCFWMEEQKTMFLGDHVLFDISPNITYWDGFEDALGNYLQSLETIRAYDVQTALPAHRGGGQMHQRIDGLIAHHDRRLQETVAIVHENPGINAYDLAGKMRWRIRARNWQEFPTMQKWFAVGETIAHLDYLVLRGQLQRREINGMAAYYAE